MWLAQSDTKPATACLFSYTPCEHCTCQCLCSAHKHTPSTWLRHKFIQDFSATQVLPCVGVSWTPIDTWQKEDLTGNWDISSCQLMSQDISSAISSCKEHKIPMEQEHLLPGNLRALPSTSHPGCIVAWGCQSTVPALSTSQAHPVMWRNSSRLSFNTFLSVDRSPLPGEDQVASTAFKVSVLVNVASGRTMPQGYIKTGRWQVP